ncbi:hypothetical protein SAMN05444422_109109 [Halobiforma haloterrestris]|uniref:Uncharacterized protein n=1 Tax=Natronobacterium haloterrestre TaxID=148448 RepID=A0A1I1JNG3_NATHA|nr:hypothetical protein SAMN05444422_109109 [Halobiforma haloterrestris]
MVEMKRNYRRRRNEDTVVELNVGTTVIEMKAPCPK